MDSFARCRAVVFDAYGTLFDVAAPTRALLGELADEVGQLWRRKQLEYSWLRSLIGRHADFAQVTAEGFTEVGQRQLPLRPQARDLPADDFFDPHPSLPSVTLSNDNVAL